MTKYDTEQLLSYYDKMIRCVEEELTPPERLAFHLWDDHRPDQVPTSDWPGFTTHGVIWPQKTDSPAAQPERRQEGPPIPSTLRWEVWERDNFTCLRCGARRKLSIDHIVPRSLGGGTTRDNLQTLCKPCNSRKGARCLGKI